MGSVSVCMCVCARVCGFESVCKNKKKYLTDPVTLGNIPCTLFLLDVTVTLSGQPRNGWGQEGSIRVYVTRCTVQGGFPPSPWKLCRNYLGP